MSFSGAPLGNSPSSSSAMAGPLVDIRIMSPSANVPSTLAYTVELQSTVKALKERIQLSLDNKPALDHQRLIYRGKLLLDDLSIESVLGRDNSKELQNESVEEPYTFHLVIRPTNTTPAAIPTANPSSTPALDTQPTTTTTTTSFSHPTPTSTISSTTRTTVTISQTGSTFSGLNTPGNPPIPSVMSLGELRQYIGARRMGANSQQTNRQAHASVAARQEEILESMMSARETDSGAGVGSSSGISLAGLNLDPGGTTGLEERSGILYGPGGIPLPSTGVQTPFPGASQGDYTLEEGRISGLAEYFDPAQISNYKSIEVVGNQASDQLLAEQLLERNLEYILRLRRGERAIPPPSFRSETEARRRALLEMQRGEAAGFPEFNSPTLPEGASSLPSSRSANNTSLLVAGNSLIYLLQDSSGRPSALLIGPPGSANPCPTHGLNLPAMPARGGLAAPNVPWGQAANNVVPPRNINVRIGMRRGGHQHVRPLNLLQGFRANAGHFWLALRLIVFVVVLAGGGGWRRMLYLGSIALFIFIWQTRIFNDFFRSIGQLFNPPPANRHAGFNQHPAPRDANGNPVNPAQALRVILRRHELRPMGAWRSFERGLTIFLASLIPGWHERHVDAVLAIQTIQRAQQYQRDVRDAQAQAGQQQQQQQQQPEVGDYNPEPPASPAVEVAEDQNDMLGGLI